MPYKAQKPRQPHRTIGSHTYGNNRCGVCVCVCAMATPCIVQSGPRGRVCVCVWVCALWPTHQSIYVLLLWFIKTYSRGKSEHRGGELSRHRRADGRTGKPCGDGDGGGMECLPAGWSDCGTRLCSCNVTCIFRSWRAGNRSQKCQQPVPCELQWNLLHDPKSSRHTCEFAGYLILISEDTVIILSAFYRFVEHMFTLIDLRVILAGMPCNKSHRGKDKKPIGFVCNWWFIVGK